MNSDEFNSKWFNYLEDGHYGMAIEDEEVIDYLDGEFEKEIKENSNFIYAQIKIKFGSSRVYANSDKTFLWENKINEILSKR